MTREDADALLIDAVYRDACSRVRLRLLDRKAREPWAGSMAPGSNSNACFCLFWRVSTIGSDTPRRFRLGFAGSSSILAVMAMAVALSHACMPCSSTSSSQPSIVLAGCIAGW
jgi:hypothetical protein